MSITIIKMDIKVVLLLLSLLGARAIKSSVDFRQSNLNAIGVNSEEDLIDLVFKLNAKVEDQKKIVQRLNQIVDMHEKEIMELKSANERLQRDNLALDNRIRQQNVDNEELRQRYLSINFTVQSKEYTPGNKDTFKVRWENAKQAVKRRESLQAKLEAGDLTKRALDYVGFSAYLDHNIPHIGVGQTLICNRILTNDGLGYNSGIGVFVAPITGAYFFTFTIHNHHRETNVQLVVDGQNIVGAVVHHTTDDATRLENNMASNSALVHIQAGQQVWLKQILDSNAELISVPDYRQVTFTGFLVYML